MIGDVVGYCIIKPDAKTGITPGNINDFLGKPIRVMEFSQFDGSVLVINSQANALATFDKEDVQISFRCKKVGCIVCPPDLSDVETYTYAMKAMSRKGGYNETVGMMVIAASLHRGVFNDAFLWQN